MKNLPKISGRGFGGGEPAQQQQQQQQNITNTPDNIRSTDHLEFVLGIGQGRFKGLKGKSAKNFYVGDTPLMSPDGVANFANFNLDFYDGDGINNTVVLSQTGAALSHQVNVTLTKNTPVVRQGTVSASVTNVLVLPTEGDYIGKVYYVTEDGSTRAMGYWLWTDKGWRRTNNPYVNFLQFRFVISQLYSQNKSGNYNHSADVKVEIKRSDQPDTDYVPAFYRNSAGTLLTRKIGGGAVDEPAPSSPGIIDSIQFYGKTQQQASKVYRVPVQASNVPYTIRVTLLTDSEYQNGDQINKATIALESFQEITSAALRLDDLAFVHATAQATDQFSSLPDFAGVYECMMVRVPSNYDPETRVYTGTWDGTFKIAYTNNPVWCLYEVVTNDDWGLSSFNPMTMDKFDCYEVAKWCDTMVSDGKGGLQPRYTLNTVISEPRPAMDMARYIAGTFNGVLLDDGNGTAYLRVDKDDPATHLIVPENTVNGTFEYSYTDVSTRYNYITVSFTNEDLRYKPDFRTLTIPEHISEYGTISTDIIAVGANNAQEGMRRAMYRLITATTENLVVKFKLPRLGQYLQPFDVALLADPDLGYGLSGRLKTVAVGGMSATLRDPLYLEAGVVYTARFSIPNPAYPINSTFKFLMVDRRVVSGTTGDVYSLTFNEPLPADLPEKAAFSLEQYNSLGVGLPKPFRILNVETSQDNPDEITVEAIEINRNKWHQIDTLKAEGIVEYSNLQLRTVSSPTNLRVIPTYHDGVVDLDIQWDRVNNQLIKAYTLEMSFNGGVPRQLSNTGATEFQLSNQEVGAYSFWVRAIGMNGDKSPVLGRRIDLTDPTVANPSGVADVSNIRFEGGSWLGQDMTLIWDRSSPANFSHYEVKFRNPSTGVTLRTVETTDERFEYTGVMNAVDNGGSAARAVLVSIRAVTNNYDIDSVPQASPGVSFLAHNPAPAAPRRVVPTWVEGGLRLEFETPTDADWSNTHVWVDTDHSWTSLDEPTYILSGNPILVPELDRSKNYFIHLSHNDQFGRNLIPSEEIAIISGVPNAPTNPNISAVRKKIGDVSAKTVITASWTASTTPELTDHYVVQIRTGPSANWKDYVTKEVMLTDIRYSAPMTDAYQMRVKSVSRASIDSDWSAIVNCVFSDDVTGPGDPTGLVVKGAYESLFVDWKNPLDEDFAGVEIYVGLTSTRPASPTDTGNKTSYVMTGLPLSAQRWFWLRAYDYSGNFGNYVGPVNGIAVPLPTLDTVPGAPAQITGLSLSSAASIMPDGTTQTTLSATWTAAPEADFLRYDIEIREATGNSSQFQSDTNVYKWIVKPNTTYYVKVRAADVALQKGLFSTEANHTTAKDTGAPGSVSGFTVLAGFENLWLNWTNPADADLAYVEVWEASANNRAGATLIGKPMGTSFIKQGLPGGSTRYYWLRAVDSSGNVSDYLPVSSTGGTVGTTLNITTTTQIADGIITTAHITVNTLNGDRIQTNTLDAGKITAGSILAGTILVGSGGPTLSTVSSNAALGASDPGGRINVGSTLIDPGKILISGGTSLANWRNGTDATKIEGGSIAANTITANKLSIGSRGIEIAGIEFSANPTTHVLTWSSGVINYISDTGTINITTIASGSVTWTTGVQYIYWVQGAAVLSTTNSIGTAYGANNVVMGTYRGGSDSVINYGRTVVDGSDIVTGTITGDRLWAGEVISLTAQIKDAIITNAKVADLSVAKLTAGTIGAQAITLVDSKFVIDGSTQRMTIKDALAATRVEIGALSAGGYGITIKDAAGNIMLSSGTTSGIAGTSILDASITNAKIADATIQAAKIGSVDATTITTGSMDAARITAGSITTDRITIGGVTTDRIDAGAVTNAVSYYSTADVYDGTAGTTIATVTMTTTGGIVNVLGYLQFGYTVYTPVYAYW